MEKYAIREYVGYGEELLALYESVGWSAYYHQSEVLKAAFAHSLCVFGAYDAGQLVGLVRTVGDGASVVFIQDILVRPEYQRRGIGRRLVAAVMQRFSHVRQIHLLTDDMPQTVGFYKAVGFTPVEELHCRAFSRLRY